MTSYKFEPIAVAETKNTKPTNMTSYKFVMFASYKFEVISKSEINTSVTSSKSKIRTSVTVTVASAQCWQNLTSRQF